MLKKLIKYEIKATSRFMFVLFATLFAISIMMAVVMRFNTGGGDLFVKLGSGEFSVGHYNVLWEIISILTVFAYFVVNIAVGCAMFFYSIDRFRKNILEKEGYLMHTLPVRAGENICAKTVVSILWTIVSCIAIVLSVLIVTVISVGKPFFTDMYNLFNTVSGQSILASSRFWLIVFEIIICGLAMLVNGYLHIYASMAVGYSFNKHRAAASIAVFLLLSVLSFAVSAIFVYPLREMFNNNHMHFAIWSETILDLVTGAGFYVITSYFLNNRLNLQ